MNTKFLIAGVAGFLVSLLLSYGVHGVLLQPDYALLPNLMRTQADAQAHFPFLLISHFVKGFAFAWIYGQGISAGVSWLTQGVRFGIAAAALIAIPMSLIYYAVEPMPGMLVVKQIVLDSVVTMVMAIVVAFVYKPKAAAEG